MKRLIILCALVLSLVSCGYHLGGFKREALKEVDTFCVHMFDNRTIYPNVSVQLTSALTDTLQRDGTYRLAPEGQADVRVQGEVRSVHASSLRPNWADTYLSSEIGLTVVAFYKVVSVSTGKVLLSGVVRGEGSYFNTGNTQTARDTALSYASRRAAELIVEALTRP